MEAECEPPAEEVQPPPAQVGLQIFAAGAPHCLGHEEVKHGHQPSKAEVSPHGHQVLCLHPPMEPSQRCEDGQNNDEHRIPGDHPAGPGRPRVHGRRVQAPALGDLACARVAHRIGVGAEGEPGEGHDQTRQSRQDADLHVGHAASPSVAPPPGRVACALLRLPGLRNRAIPHHGPAGPHGGHGCERPPRRGKTAGRGRVGPKAARPRAT
mmetsp:Transcript_26098/g.78659  ORF Transcript_26098/g.78659 Transcript_26098/m.78659 type:complete len:210 (-) Transcript_26098:2-631(-)